MTVANKIWTITEKGLRLTIVFFLSLLGRKISERQWQAFLQFIKFCLVGVSNTAISLAVYYIFILINRELYIIGNVTGFVISVLNSYFWNSRFVFQKKNERGKTILKTFMAYGTTLILGTVLLYVFVELMYVSEFIAPLINLIVTIPINFLLNKLWVMR